LEVAAVKKLGAQVVAMEVNPIAERTLTLTITLSLALTLALALALTLTLTPI